MSVTLKRYLTNQEHVDHIDNDKTNDSISNLQILTPKENNQKSFLKGETLLDFICPICKKEFTNIYKPICNWWCFRVFFRL